MIMFILAGAAGVSLISKLVSGSFNPLNMIDLTPKGEFRDTNPPLTAAQQQAVIANIANATRRTAIPGTSGGLGGSILVDDDVLIAPGQFFNPQFPPPGVDTITPVLSRVLEPVGNMTPLGIPSILVRPLDSRVQSGLGHMVPLSSVLLVSRR